jgi:hypothetical protein
MVWGRSLRLGAGILAALLLSAGVALAGTRGTYNGAGNAFTITIQASKTRIKAISISCKRGALTVQATGPFPRIKDRKFSYSGGERSSTTAKTLKMKVTGTFSRTGKTVKGHASTAGQCPAGNYTAKK